MQGCGWAWPWAADQPERTGCQRRLALRARRRWGGRCAPGPCGSRVTSSRYALGAEGVGATRPSAHMCSLTVPVCLTHPKLRTRRARRGGVRAMRPIPGVSHAPNPAGFEPRLALCRNSGPCPLCAPSTYNMQTCRARGNHRALHRARSTVDYVVQRSSRKMLSMLPRAAVERGSPAGPAGG